MLKRVNLRTRSRPVKARRNLRMFRANTLSPLKLRKKLASIDAICHSGIPLCQMHNKNFGTIAGICAGLMALVWFVFGPSVHFPFVNYDDPNYTYENPTIVRGLTWSGVVWAFTHAQAGNWHPLTTISHMLDCELFDLRAEDIISLTLSCTLWQRLVFLFHFVF